MALQIEVINNFPKNTINTNTQNEVKIDIEYAKSIETTKTTYNYSSPFMKLSFDYFMIDTKTTMKYITLIKVYLKHDTKLYLFKFGLSRELESMKLEIGMGNCYPIVKLNNHLAYRRDMISIKKYMYSYSSLLKRLDDMEQSDNSNHTCVIL